VHCEHDITGEMFLSDEPDWQPLLDLIGEHLTGWFMWMCAIELDDETRVHAYKHRATRRYFHLAVDGRAFMYLPRGRYREIDRCAAIDIAFERWEDLAPQPDDEDRTALRSVRQAVKSQAHRRQQRWDTDAAA
jgi:hypothetical protein